MTAKGQESGVGGRATEIGSQEPGAGGHEPARDGSTSRSMLAAARHDEPAGWTRLVSLYSPLIGAWCRRWGVAPQDVGDVVQDVFAAVARNLDRFRKEEPCDTFRGWLATIARNKVHDYFRRRGDEPAAAGGTEAWLRISQISDGAPSDDGSDEADHVMFGEILRQALDTIRGEFHERTWQAFWGTVVEGKVAADVAAELAMRPGGVRVAKSRVLCRLRRELGDGPMVDREAD
jgi:RNA polymerase sigma-70 factor, ECF subfamily